MANMNVIFILLDKTYDDFSDKLYGICDGDRLIKYNFLLILYYE